MNAVQEAWLQPDGRQRDSARAEVVKEQINLEISGMIQEPTQMMN